MSGGSGSAVQKVHTLGTVGEIDAKESGTWDYVSGTGGGTEVISGRVVGAFFYAHNAAGTVQIDGGSLVQIRRNIGITLNPKGNLLNPTIVMSGSIDYMIEYVV